MKVDINKGIWTKIGRNVLGGCRDNNYDLSLVDLFVHLLLCELLELLCHKSILICLELIIQLIECACTILLLPKLYTILLKTLRPSVKSM